MKNVAILGASGFVGHEIIKICLKHPYIKIEALSANKSAGEKVQNLHSAGIQDTLEYKSHEDIDFSCIDFIFNCLPNESLHKKSDLLKSNINIIDLSIDFRLDDKAEYKNWYGFEHKSMDVNNEFKYGLTEFNRNEIRKSKHIANPGCYATSILIPLIELINQNAIKTNDIIIDSKSGYSGAGKTKNKEELIIEVNENIRTYGIGDHKHIAEINQELTKIKNIHTEVFFAANILPVERGILSNIYIDTNGTSQNEIYDILQKRFIDESFIQLLPMNEIPSSREVVGTNNLVIGLKKGYKENKLCIVSALDNLIKGAAGQAIQNFNIMNEYDEILGLVWEIKQSLFLTFF